MNLKSTNWAKRPIALAVWPLVLAVVVAACTTAQPTPPPTNTPFPFTPPPATVAPTPSATPETPTPPATATPSHAPSETPTPKAQPSPTPAISASLLEDLQRIEERVSAERGLSGADNFAPRFMTRPELQAFFTQRLEESTSEEELATTQEILELLGLLEEGHDLRKLLLELDSESVLGFFDPETGDLVVVGEVEEFGALEEITYAHEFTHALQHQRFDLQAIQDLVEDDSEAAAGLRALVEGDATLSMYRYIFEHLTRRQIQSLSEDDGEGIAVDAPPFLVDSRLFPYREGLEFALTLFRAGGWEAVDHAYAAPPVSTEQIMHPEKYRSMELPITVSLPDLGPTLGEGWEQRDTETLGEFDLKLLLKVHLSESRASRAAAGWGGDRFVYFKGPGGERLLVSLVAWDSPEDAEEFFDAYSRWLRSQDIEPVETETDLAWSTLGRRSSLGLLGDRTLLVLAPAGVVSEQVLSLFPEFGPSEEPGS